jgi:hypothetical protein
MAESQRDFAQGEAAAIPRQLMSSSAEATGWSLGGTWRPIVDWTDVFPGNRGVNRQGIYDLYDAPVGIALRIEEADKSAPLLIAERPWEGDGQIVPVAFWQADARYHMLYTVWDRRAKLDRAAKALGGERTCTCYAVSDDASYWTRPELGLVEYEGSSRNNILPTTLTGTPFLDPTAPPGERFRAMGQEGANYDPETGEQLSSEEAGRRLTARDREGLGYRGPRVESRHWITGWTSADGIHWKRTEQPLANMPSDGGNAAQYDPEKGSYFAYIRTGGMGRRAIGLTRTDTFWHWPAPELVLAPDPQDDPEISFYGGNYFPYPGRTDLHGMVVQIYHQRTDHLDNQIAFSRNGIHWYRPERRACLPVGGPGSGEEGIVRCALTGLSRLPDGCWGALYEGASMLHNATGVIEHPPGQIAWARWQPHRFCGVEAVHEGRFTIPTAKRQGNQVRLNYRCKLGGYISVELIPAIPSRVNPDAQGIAGYTFAESDRLTGDALDGVVTWQGRSDTCAAGDSFALRIRMFQAKLFAYSVG